MAIETECSADRPYIVGEDNLIEALKESMRKKLGPAAKSPLTVRSCIFKVPQVLRRHKPEAYEPHVISIGPIHRDGRKQFQRMETVKQWYLKGSFTKTPKMGVEIIKKPKHYLNI
ncbi:unnamed protein product [Prunus armeniaca]|uniref:Uncharacterized protein n=1 Tax=Prunus armeniaca TaxID=36596 RepID=A0A6J5VK86_PRUAR|nr:unnamed protein product [Prunus armeniaca]